MPFAELTVEVLKDALFRGPVRFYDGRKGSRHQAQGELR